MSNNDSTNRSELPKLVDDGRENNYGEWKTKSYHKLREWDLLKYIEGPDSNPPIIPPLRERQTFHGVDDAGNQSTVHVPGNAAEHQTAVRKAKPWTTGNNIALSRIVAAVPGNQLHLVEHTLYAKNAWESLRSVYQPNNSLRASTIKGQIMTYRCSAEMDVSKWLDDMQRLYNSLCNLEVERMTDREFALAILDLMPLDDGWRDFVSNLRTKVRDLDALGSPIRSVTFTTTIRDEYWHRHKDDHQSSSHIFSARFDAQKRAHTSKRTRPTNIATNTSSSKRTRYSDNNRANLRCTNAHCKSKLGHDSVDCLAYTGAKQGQYPDHWKGPWNIHLPETQRSANNNIPPKLHPASKRWYGPNINQTVTGDDPLARSATAHIDELPDTHANAVLLPDADFYAWNTIHSETVAHATLPVLSPSIPKDNSCHHDSGANRHVFHDRSAFEDYENITPITVKGFGHNLSAMAIGRGTVRLQGRYKGTSCTILLSNVLHIPEAQTNLISGVQLSKARVVCTLDYNSITLACNGKPLVSGTIVNDMYRLDVSILRPTTVSLASRLAPQSLASRITPNNTSRDFYTTSWGT